MDDKADEVALIEIALAAIEQVLARGAADHHAVPFHGVTELSALPEEEREARLRLERESYSAQPEHSAVQLCLRGAAALLNVSQALSTSSAHPSPREREHQLNCLVSYAKTAGRSAYRAALILMMPADS